MDLVYRRKRQFPLVYEHEPVFLFIGYIRAGALMSCGGISTFRSDGVAFEDFGGLLQRDLSRDGFEAEVPYSLFHFNRFEK